MPAATGYLRELGLHVVATRFELKVSGQVVAAKNFGKKAGLTTFTCTQTEGTVVFTLTATVVPPR